jgi:hypothetical protein
MSVRAATRRMVESSHQYDAIYRGHLANHLPMAVVALEGLGATDVEIVRFARTHAMHLEPLRPPQSAVARGEEGHAIGQPDAFPAWLARFEAEIDARGTARVLNDWTDRLLPGVSGGAFHGVIRVAYALETGSAAELAHALAYWSSCWQSLGGPPAFTGTLTPAQVLARMAADPAFAGKRAAGSNIAERTAAAADAPALRAHVASANPARVNLDSLAEAALHAYAASGDFTTLHMVTGVHAARTLLPYSAAGGDAHAHLWLALAAAFAGAGSPGFVGWAAKRGRDEDWDVLRARAIRCEDEHDVKIAYTCWREWQRTGDDLYRQAASARLRPALEEANA